MEQVPPKKEPSADWQRAVALAVMLTLSVVFWSSPPLYPVRMLVVFLHELSHGIVAMATGGRVVEIQLHPGEGGLCITQGGSRFLTLNAGYLGSLIWGGVMLTMARREKLARFMMGTLGVILVLSALLWVRPVFGFGMIFTLVAGVAVLGFCYGSPSWACTGVLQFVGLLSMLYVLIDIKRDILGASSLESDATLLAGHTGIPGFVWGLAWLAIALALSGAFLRDACMPTRRRS